MNSFRRLILWLSLWPFRLALWLCFGGRIRFTYGDNRGQGGRS